VRSYFANDKLESIKTRHLVGLIADLDTIVVPSEAHALILEANLIKEYRPRFNIALRDDKSYPYIKVTVQEPFPRVHVTRRLEDDGASYFGPYTDVGAMRRALNVVKRIFTVRSCNYDMPAQMPERPCLDLLHQAVQGALHSCAITAGLPLDDRRGSALPFGEARRGDPSGDGADGSRRGAAGLRAGRRAARCAASSGAHGGANPSFSRWRAAIAT